jgi:hypothetical protein
LTASPVLLGLILARRRHGDRGVARERPKRVAIARGEQSSARRERTADVKDPDQPPLPDDRHAEHRVVQHGRLSWIRQIAVAIRGDLAAGPNHFAGDADPRRHLGAKRGGWQFVTGKRAADP